MEEGARAGRCARTLTQTPPPSHPPPSQDANEPKGQRQAKSQSGKFDFTRVFGPAASQAAVFDAIGRPLVERAVHRAGSNGLLFAYGMTNAGKTYTICGKGGGTGDDAGILPRALAALFEALPAAAAASAASSASAAAAAAAPARGGGGGSEAEVVLVLVSYLEVYMEQVTDLLTGEGNLKIGCVWGAGGWVRGRGADLAVPSGRPGGGKARYACAAYACGRVPTSRALTLPPRPSGGDLLQQRRGARQPAVRQRRLQSAVPHRC